MANLHTQFKQFEDRISITSTQKDLIIKRHTTLKSVITEYFKKKEGIKVPDYYIQGSYKMKTMVQKEDGSFDVDLGVFLKEKPNLTPTTIQSYVLDAVKNQTASGAQHLKKCIRVNYAGEFNADLPAYYQDEYSKAYIAVKNDGWVRDDPEEFVNWVENNRNSKEINNDGQLIRIIKYLKKWTNRLPFKTPSGVAITVWACTYFKAAKDRDDESLFKTIESIYSSIWWWSVSCKCPVEPYDDLLSNLDSTQKDKFKEALKKFKDDASKAINEKDKDIAVSYWQKHLGDKFKI